uniref:RHS repeat domain-containing protein n=1 Tax=Roseimaritima sediminicola TaxID=2662066 RepID=UPI001386A256
LQSADRGQLNTAHSAIQTLDLAQCWTLDPTGNWSHYRQDDNGNGTWNLIQDRTANTVNEITDIDNPSGTPWATPAYDKNGNSTSIPRPDLGSGASMTATYDAWNRMTKLVDNSTSNTLLENEFDGRNFRIVAKQYSGGTLSDTRHFYFTDSWQCVEERLGSGTTPERQHVWGLRYIDDLVVRDRDTNADGTLDERLYHCADANWNTVTVVDSGGSVAERYEYDPYGQLSFFAADYTVRTTSSYDTRYTYTNREWTPDAAIYYFRNRWYSAQLGRFCSRDPIGYGDGMHLFNYLVNQPLVLIDPFGLVRLVPERPTPRREPHPRIAVIRCYIRCLSSQDSSVEEAIGEYEYLMRVCEQEWWTCYDETACETQQRRLDACTDDLKQCRNEATLIRDWMIGNAIREAHQCIARCNQVFPQGIAPPIRPAELEQMTPSELEEFYDFLEILEASPPHERK